MLGTPRSPTSSIDTMDSERTLPMQLEASDPLRSHLPSHLLSQSTRRHCPTVARNPKTGKIVHGSIWEECQSLEEVSYLTIESKLVAGVPLYECQVHSSGMVPQTPHSVTDSLSSTSPPFGFHQNHNNSGGNSGCVNISPAVENPPRSVSTRPPSPVFPARPPSPINRNPPISNGSSSAHAVSLAYSPYTTSSQTCCYPVYMPNMPWLAPSPISTNPPAAGFFDGTSVLACYLPSQTSIQSMPFMAPPEFGMAHQQPAQTPLPSQQQGFSPQMTFVPQQTVQIRMSVPGQQNNLQTQQQGVSQFPAMMDPSEWAIASGLIP